MKIIDYGLILHESKDSAEAYNTFRRMVRERIAEGWEPQGGVSTFVWIHPVEGAVYSFAQAMILREGMGEPIE